MAQANTNSGVGRINREMCKSALVLLGVGLLASVTVFAAFPQLDDAASAAFGGTPSGFPLRSSALLEALRQVFIYITNGSILILLGCWALSILRPKLLKRGDFFRRVCGFSVLAYILIPGVVVNGIIKPLWGRVRPYNTVEFGGAQHFTTPFELSGQCSKACSFVSGETSALFTCALLALLFIVPRIAKNWRGPMVTLILGSAVFGSGLRIFVGAHFLSDVVFSALLSSALVLALALWFSAAQSPARTAESAFGRFSHGQRKQRLGRD